MPRTSLAVASAPDTRQAGTNSYIWTVLTVAVATQTAGSLVSQGVYILVPFWRDAYGISLASASLAVTVMNGTQIATIYVIGRAIDLYGERIVVGIAMLGMAAAMAAASFATGLTGLLLSMAFLGGTYAAVQPGGTRAIMRWFPPRHRALATGFRQAAVPLGTMIAAALLPLLVVHAGLPAAAWFSAGISLLGSLLFLAFYREGEQQSAGAGNRDKPLPLRALVRTVGLNPRFWPVLRLGIAMSAFQFTFTAHAIGYMAGSLGLGIVGAASLFAIAQLAGIPGRVVLPCLSDRLWPGRRPRSFAVIALIGATTVAIFAALPGDTPSWLAACVLVTFGLFGIGWFPLYLLEIAEMAPPTSVASTVSFASTLCLIAMALGPWFFGLIVDHFGYAAAWTLLTAPVVIVALPLTGLLGRSNG
ncbi:MFS transporter [Bosea sp. RAF48]|uniref:MFS transporter n=1 Tax=Bosea sp. RAF48 TaxID=3237480 RepID=UPI003F9289F7